MQTAMSGVEELGIRTADKKVWAASGLDMALSSIERMQRSLIRSAQLFRDGSIVEANRYLVICIEGLERFAETIFVTRCALSLDFTQIPVEDRTLAAVEKDFANILRGILACQEKNDYEGIADGLEYSLLTNIVSWRSGLRQLRNAQLSNA